MSEKTNYGKIIAITLAVITSACTIAFVIYRLFRNLITFCNTYTVPEKDEELALDEVEEILCDEECDETCEETPEDEEAPAEEAAE